MTARRLLSILLCAALGVLVVWWVALQSTAAPPILRFAVANDSYPDEFWNHILAEYEVMPGGTRVELVAINSAGNFDLMSGSVDVALVAGQVVREQRAQFTDLSAWGDGINNALEPMALNSLRCEGKLRALPFAAETVLIYFNRKCFDNASAFHIEPVNFPGPQWTISEFINTAEQLTCDFDRDGMIDQFGLLLPDWSHFQPLMKSMGASLTSEDGLRWALTGTEAIGALGLYRRLATGDRVAAKATELSAASVSAALLSGKVAMVLGETGLAAGLRKANTSFEFGVAHIPRGKGGRETEISWSVLVIPESKNHEKRIHAAHFIQHLLSLEVQTRLAKLGMKVPARLDAYDAFAAEDADRRRPFIESLSYSHILPFSLNNVRIAEILNHHLDRIADPASPFLAQAILDSLANDPVILKTFPAYTPTPPR